MKVKELIEVLKKANPESDIYVTCSEDDPFEYRAEIKQVYENKMLSKLYTKMDYTGTYIEF